MPQKRKSKVKSLIRLLGFALLGAILYFIDLEKLFENLLSVRIGYLALAFVATVPVYFFKSGRWYLLMRTQGIPYSFKHTFLAWTSSNFIAFVTPGRIGEVAKAFYVKKDTEMPFSSTFPTVILDRLFDVYFLMIIAVIGFFRFSLLAHFEVLSWISIGVIAMAPWFLLKKEFSLPLIRLLVRLPGMSRFEQKILGAATHFFEEMKKLLNTGLILSALLTIGAYVALFSAVYLIAISAGIPIDFISISIFTAVANVLSFIPISVSGVGTREASMIFLFSLIGLSAEMAVLQSSLYFFVFFVIGGLIGYGAFLIKPIRIDTITKSAQR